MLFLCSIYPRNIEDPEIKELVKEYERRFGKKLVFSSYVNYRRQGKATMERIYRGILETALKEEKPFEPPNQLRAAAEFDHFA